MALLRKGLRGEPVRRLQEKLGVAVDGIFGPGTEAALKEYQSDNGLKVDGIAGPDTFSDLGLFELVLLKRGQRGAAVKRLQEALGVGADGIFGAGTEAALKQYQKDQSLVVDGIAGPATLATMDLFTEFTEEVVDLSDVPIDYIEPEVPVAFDPFKADEETKKASDEANAAAAAEPEKKGVWGTVKGWFS